MDSKLVDWQNMIAWHTYCLHHSCIVNGMVHKGLQFWEFEPVFIPHEVVNDPYFIVYVNS